MGHPEGLSPAVDHRSQRLFVPLYGPFSVLALSVNAATHSTPYLNRSHQQESKIKLGVFDLSVPDKVTVLKTIPTPGDNIHSIQYDSVADTVWLVASVIRTSTSSSCVLATNLQPCMVVLSRWR